MKSFIPVLTLSMTTIASARQLESEPFFELWSRCTPESAVDENFCEDGSVKDFVSTAPHYPASKCACYITENEPSSMCAEVCYIVSPEIGDKCPYPNKAARGENWEVDEQCSDPVECYVTQLIEQIIPPGQKPTDPRLDPVTFKCESPTSTDGPTVAPTDAPTYVSTPAPTPPSCDHYAYDNQLYCKCPAPKPVGKQYEVSVCGDATYLLPESVQPCSGPITEKPAGTGCPKKDDTAVRHCRDQILSYLTGGKKGPCKAPEDAKCEKLETGAWGCIFPGNCNTINGCLGKPKCTGDYVKDAEGNCVINPDNGYPVPTPNNTNTVDTSKLPKLQKGTNLKTIGAASTTNVAMTSILFSVVIGGFMLV